MRAIWEIDKCPWPSYANISLSLSLLTPLTFRRPPISVFTDTHNYSLPLHRKAASQWLQMTHSLLHNSARLTLHALLKMSINNCPVRTTQTTIRKNACHNKADILALIQHIYKNPLCLFCSFLGKNKGNSRCLEDYYETKWKTGSVWTKVENFAVKVSFQTMLEAVIVVLVVMLEADCAVLYLGN